MFLIVNCAKANIGQVRTDNKSKADESCFNLKPNTFQPAFRCARKYNYYNRIYPQGHVVITILATITASEKLLLPLFSVPRRTKWYFGSACITICVSTV